MRRTLLLAVAAAAATALAFVPSAGATIWTTASSGLSGSDQIRAIEYQSPTRLWLATANGKIATRQGDGSFAVQTVTSAVNGFNDIAFKPGAAIGVAVGNNGYIERTTNGGASWTRVSFTELTANDRTDSYGCGGFNNGTSAPLTTTTNPLIPLFSVHWGPGSTVLVTGHDGTVLKSTDDGGSFTEINRYQRPYSATDPSPTIGCRLENGNTGDVFDAQFASTTDANAIYFQVDGGPVFYTDNGLASGHTPVQTSDIGCGGVFGRLALDLAQPAHQWSVTDRGSASPCLYFTTTTSADIYQSVTIPNANGATFRNSEDIAVAGTSPPTVVTVGSGGDILNSVDGTNFYVNKLSNEDGTDYYAVSGYDRNNFAVGGATGKLLLTTAGGTIPDQVAPAGVITGPATVTAGTPATFTAAVSDNVGGSGIDPAGFTWSAAGLPGATGQTVNLTFPAAGDYYVTVNFRDLSGNTASANMSVHAAGPTGTAPPPTGIASPATTIPIGTKNPTPSKTAGVSGGSIKLAGPSTCVPLGKSFTAKLSYKKPKKAKKGKLKKVSKVTFSIDGVTTKVDKKPPFRQTLKITHLAANSTHVFKAKATIKIRRGKSKTKAVTTAFQVCAT
jgi:photosystem II stability/assembly factor-like uncharacterized protein